VIFWKCSKRFGGALNPDDDIMKLCKRAILVPIIKAALSKIHVSFDLWTSPNKLAMLGVVAHYLSPDLTAKSPMVALRKLSGNHSGENQAKILLQVAKEFDLASKEILGYFIADTTSLSESS
jgi:hypothetical protein